MSGIKDRHFMSNSPEYKTWEMMIQRCTNPKYGPYNYYGGRGIKVCDEWLDFKNFWKDMGDRPKGKTIDRKDVNGDYCKSNCQWATKSEQTYNTRKRTDNTSGFCGVYYHKASNKWMAAINLGGKQKYLGLYVDQQDALAARIEAEKLYYSFSKNLISEKEVDVEDIS